MPRSRPPCIHAARQLQPGASNRHTLSATAFLRSFPVHNPRDDHAHQNKPDKPPQNRTDQRATRAACKQKPPQARAICNPAAAHDWTARFGDGTAAPRTTHARAAYARRASCMASDTRPAASNKSLHHSCGKRKFFLRGRASGWTGGMAPPLIPRQMIRPRSSPVEMAISVCLERYQRNTTPSPRETTESSALGAAFPVLAQELTCASPSRPKARPPNPHLTLPGSHPRPALTLNFGGVALHAHHPRSTAPGAVPCFPGPCFPPQITRSRVASQSKLSPHYHSFQAGVRGTSHPRGVRRAGAARAVFRPRNVRPDQRPESAPSSVEKAHPTASAVSPGSDASGDWGDVKPFEAGHPAGLPSGPVLRGRPRESTFPLQPRRLRSIIPVQIDIEATWAGASAPHQLA